MPLFTPGFDVERYIYLLLESDRLQKQWRAVRDYRDYYGGNHPVFLTDRQEEYLGPLLTQAEHTTAFNVCKAVIDTLRERLRVTGFTGNDAAGEALAERIGAWWHTARMDAQQITVHRRALRDGKSYLILAWDEAQRQPVWVPNRAYDGTEGVTFYKDPDSGHPVIALKYWSITDPLSAKHGEKRRTVYLPDRILRYREDPKGNYGWSLIQPDEGEPLQWWTDTLQEGGAPLGVACVEFENPGGVSELEDVIGLQNGLNKTLLDLLAAADATGFQIVTISYTGPMGPAATDDEDTTSDDLQIAPGRALELFDGSTAGTIPPGDLNQLIAALRTLVGAVSASSRTPQYYLWPLGGSDVPSGEALKQLESALVARAQERTMLFAPAWEDAMRLGARLYRAMGYTDIDPEAQIAAQWASVEVRNEFIDAQIAEKHLALGVPAEVLWAQRLGYTPEEVEDFKRQKATEEAQRIANVVGSINFGNAGTATNGASQGGAVGRSNGQSAQNGVGRGA